MKLFNGSIFLLLLSYASVSVSQSVTDKIMRAFIEKSLPSTLYEHTDKAWQMGVYSLSVEKAGQTTFATDEKQFNLSLPIYVNIKATVNKTILGQKILFHCKSTMNTTAVIHITPDIAPIKPTKNTTSTSTADVIVEIPTPDTFLNCDGFNLPVKPIVDQLIKEKKPQWEKELTTNINKAFKDIGI